MKYYLVKFYNHYAECSRTVRTEKTIEDIENWINNQKGIFKNERCKFLEAEEVTENEFNLFIKCFEETEQDAVIKISTI